MTTCPGSPAQKQNNFLQREETAQLHISQLLRQTELRTSITKQTGVREAWNMTKTIAIKRKVENKSEWGRRGERQPVFTTGWMRQPVNGTADRRSAPGADWGVGACPPVKKNRRDKLKRVKCRAGPKWTPEHREEKCKKSDGETNDNNKKNC